MKIKSLKKLAGILNRSEGASLIAIIALLVIMSVMGGVFSSVMGRWKISAPTNINSSKAHYLAEAAAMFALQDAKYRFFSVDATSTPPGEPLFPSATTGTRSAPYIVLSSSTESAEYWIERPYPSANTISANEIPPNAINVDEYPTGIHLGNNDDDTIGVDDDVVDDDLDDASDPTLYSIIATGKIKRGGATVAKRQVKVLTTIYPSPPNTVTPGVQTSGVINGTGGVGNGFGMKHNGFETEFIAGENVDEPPDSSENTVPPIVIRPAQTLDENFVKALAIDQGHYNAGDLTIDNFNDDYPEPATPSFYYDSPTDTIPNMTYIGQDLIVGSNRKAHGVIWVKGNVVLNGTATMDAIIICEGNVTFNGDSNIIGGIIHYGDFINGNGNPNAITVNDTFFHKMSATIPIITVQSWQEAVSAN